MSTSSYRPVVASIALATLTAVPLACGFNTHGDVPSTGGGGATSTTSTTGGGGASTFCTPNAVSPCYTGPTNTLGVGICKAGTKTCDADGAAFGPCTGEVQPAAADDCATGLDENCDGTPNEACPCDPGTMQACYSGAAGTEGVGPCQGGTQTCNPSGMGFGPCMGEITPLPEVCSTPIDEDCDGKVFDDTDDSCVCDPTAAAVSCYSGPPGTAGIGICAAGTQTCNPDGKSLGPCNGESLPMTEDCTTAADEDCDGKAFDDTGDGCLCQPGTSLDCGTGLVGVCMNGSQTCNPDGKAYGACTPKTPASTEDCATANADENCDGDNACTGGAIAGKIKGANNQDAAFAVAVDAAGNFVAGGIIDATITSNLFTAGSLWFAKYTPAGGLSWEKSFAPTGAGSYAVAYGVATDAAGNVFAGGEFKGTLVIGGTTLVSDTVGGGVDAFLLKLDGAGNVVWVKSFGTSGVQSVASVAVDAGGNVLFCGGMAGTPDFGGGALTATGLSTDAFVVKLANDGTHVWSKRAGDAGYQKALGIAALPGGDVVFVGELANHMNFGTDLDGGNDLDAFAIRLTGATGAFVWGDKYGDGDDQTARGVAVDPQGNLVITGDFEGNMNLGNGNIPSTNNNATRDVFVAKLAADGTHVWSKGFGTANDQTGTRVAVDGLGNAVVTGVFTGTINFGGTPLVNPSTSIGDIFVAKLKSSDGGHIWSKAFGDGSGDQAGLDVAVDKLGNIVVAGGFQGTADFGAPVGTLTSGGGYDIFAVKLKP